MVCNRLFDAHNHDTPANTLGNEQHCICAWTSNDQCLKQLWRWARPSLRWGGPEESKIKAGNSAEHNKDESQKRHTPIIVTNEGRGATSAGNTAELWHMGISKAQLTHLQHPADGNASVESAINCECRTCSRHLPAWNCKVTLSMRLASK